MSFNQDIAIALTNKKIYNNIHIKIHCILCIIINGINNFVLSKTFYILLSVINILISFDNLSESNDEKININNIICMYTIFISVYVSFLVIF